MVEKGGIEIENILVQKNPVEQKNLCPICKNEAKKSNITCNTNNVGYRWVCDTCTENGKTKVYKGESSRPTGFVE